MNKHSVLRASPLPPATHPTELQIPVTLQPQTNNNTSQHNLNNTQHETTTLLQERENITINES